MPPIPTAALNCNLVHRMWNKTVDEPHVSQRGPVSVSPFRVRTDPAELLRLTRQEQPTTWFCSLVNPDYIDLKRYVLNYPLRLGFLFLGVLVYRACT